MYLSLVVPDQHSTSCCTPEFGAWYTFWSAPILRAGVHAVNRAHTIYTTSQVWGIYTQPGNHSVGASLHLCAERSGLLRHGHPAGAAPDDGKVIVIRRALCTAAKKHNFFFLVERKQSEKYL